MHTTLDLLTAHHACSSTNPPGGLRKFLDYYGRDYPRDRSISMRQIVESNGLDDALWCIRAFEPVAERDRAARLLTCDYAEHVIPIYIAAGPEDNGLALLLAIHIAKEFAEGRATEDDLAAARAAAAAAACDAACAGARNAACTATRAAAWDACTGVWVAAMDAAGAAAWDAAWDAAGAAAWDAAWDAERQWQTERLLEWFPEEPNP